MSELLLSTPPENVLRLDRELWDVCSKGNYVKVEDAARLLGISDDVLRDSIYRAECPFAIGRDRLYSSDGKIKENGVARIPVLPFYNFMTQHWLYYYKMFLQRVKENRQTFHGE